jgi:cbb3-type cytochrome oxidase subunit 3
MLTMMITVILIVLLIFFIGVWCGLDRAEKEIKKWKN